MKSALIIKENEAERASLKRFLSGLGNSVSEVALARNALESIQLKFKMLGLEE